MNPFLSEFESQVALKMTRYLEPLFSEEYKLTLIARYAGKESDQVNHIVSRDQLPEIFSAVVGAKQVHGPDCNAPTEDKYVPGTWRCAKCNFFLNQRNLNANDGSVTARDQPGEPCPNCNVPLWRVTWKEEALLLSDRLEEMVTQQTNLRDKILSTPELLNFSEAVRLEAMHQRSRFSSEHDEGKAPEDWLWLVAYLATKASQASRYGDIEKYLHHIITCAAACLNWHANATGHDTSMRSGPPIPAGEG